MNVFCIFCIFWYGGIFYIFEHSHHLITSQTPFFLGVFTIIHDQSSSFITKRQKKSLVGHNTSSEQTMLLRSKLISINCKNTVKQCEKLSYSYWFIDRDFDDLSNGDYSQQSIALITIIFVSAITALLIPFAECVPRPSFFQIFDYF